MNAIRDVLADLLASLPLAALLLLGTLAYCLLATAALNSGSRP